MNYRPAFTFAVPAALLSTVVQAAPTLSPVWIDHAVIQRGQPITVEGSATPGGTVHAILGEVAASAKAGEDGRFHLTFPAREASAEPVSLTVSEGNASTGVDDLVVGDVWLCSGQSNMELPVARALNSYNEIRSSADPLLRLLTIPKATAPTPSARFGGEVAWTTARPETVADFSAACFYMAQNLRHDLNIPIGAIHASWGGSQIRPWLSPAGGEALYGAAQMALVAQYAADPLGAVSAFMPRWQDWYSKAANGSKPWADPDALGWQSVPQMSPWNEWAGTKLAKDAIGNVWFRHTLDLTAAQAEAGGTLAIGIIDDMDSAWVNGRPVGNTFSWDQEREYRVPASYLKAGANEIIFVASNSYGHGGITSPADVFGWTVTGGERISLTDGWRYAISPVKEVPPRAPWDANAGIGVMHNTMIAPLGHIGLAGAAWYQGESDVGIPGYRDRMRELFAGWRAQFDPSMRMLVVQLANYGTPSDRPTASGWAELRQDQLLAVMADRNAALVTAIDLGERTDIHPANKIELGHRLALAAQGQAMPMPGKGTLSDDMITLTFSGVEGGLHAWSGPLPLAVELCGATQASCRYALASLDGDRMTIPGDGKPATRIRYGWADNPVVNSYDVRPMPLPAFEVPIAQ